MLSQTVNVMSQKYAVVIVMRDLRESVLTCVFPPEPLFAVLDVFDNIEDAEFYSRFTATKQYPWCSIDIVDMYQRLFPENKNVEQVREVYADEGLDDIMAGRKDSMNNASKYERWCAATKNKPDVMVVKC